MYRYYDVLDVVRRADDAAIKQAYRKQSLKLHPDKCGGSTEAFQELDRAYKVLADAKKREEYDRLGLDLNEREAEDLETQIDNMGFKASGEVLVAIARTGIAGLFVLLLPHYWPFRWVQGLAGVGLSGLGILLPRSEQTRWREDKVRSFRVFGGHLLAFLAAGWLSYQTSFGRRWHLSWLYETRVLFVASRYTEGRLTGMLGVHTLCCFIAGRWLNTRSSRWAALLALETFVSFAAVPVCSLIGKRAAAIANKKFDNYAKAVKSVVDLEADQKLHFQHRVVELEEQRAAQAQREAGLDSKLAATTAKLDKYVAYAKQAQGVVGRHIAHKKELEARIRELEDSAKRRK